MWLPPAAGRLCGCPAGRRGEDLEVFFPSLFNKGGSGSANHATLLPTSRSSSAS